MTVEKKHLDKLDKAPENSPKVLKGETIKSTKDNALQERSKLLDGLRSYKLTGEGQMSFQIAGEDKGKKISAKDARPLRQPGAPGKEALLTSANLKNESGAILKVELKLPASYLGEFEAVSQLSRVETLPQSEHAHDKALKSPSRGSEANLEKHSEHQNQQFSEANKKLESWANKQEGAIDHRLAELKKSDHLTPAEKNEKHELEVEKQQLELFKANLIGFENRAKVDGLSPKEVNATLFQLGRMTDAVGETPMSSKDRRHVTEQIMKQAADPRTIDQGQHLTCNVTVVEARTYSRTPSEAARLVVDLSLTHHYESTGHPLIKLDISPQPHNESKKFPTSDGDRSYASEIFQVAAVNIYYEKNHANIEYVQNEHGELLIDKTSHKPITTGPFGLGDPIRNPDLPDTAYSQISDALNGIEEGADVAIVHEHYKSW